MLLNLNGKFCNKLLNVILKISEGMKLLMNNV